MSEWILEGHDTENGSVEFKTVVDEVFKGKLTRCRDCKHWKEGMKGIMFCEAVHLVRSADDYCSKAEPRQPKPHETETE